MWFACLITRSQHRKERRSQFGTNTPLLLPSLIHVLLCQYHSNGAVIDFGRFTCEGWLTWTLAAPSCWLGNHLCTQSASAPLSPYPLWQTCVDDAAPHSRSFHHGADNSFAAACEMVKHIYCFNRWGLDDSIQEVKRKWWKVNLLMQAR